VGEAKGKVSNFETSLKTRGGQKIPVAISAAIIYGDNGEEVGSIGFAKDIREIRRRDQLATLCEVAIGLSHEVNNSLEVLVNQIEMLQSYVGRVATDEDYLVESERLESVAAQIKKIQDITAKIGRMAGEGEYETKEYLAGKMMTDLEVEPRKRCLERAKGEGRHPLKGLRILVVDDDPAVCESLRELLEEEYCTVQTTSSGTEAIAYLEHHDVDLVLSDVVMPDMDGYQVYQTIKSRSPQLPVVLMTAFNYDKDHIIKRSCLEGLQGVIFKKPVNPILLKKMVLQQCRANGSIEADDHRSASATPRA
jgi:CheY-like chemotaxis protein